MVSRFIRRTNFEQMVSLSTKPAFAVFPIYNLIFPLSLSNKFIYFICQRKKYKKIVHLSWVDGQYLLGFGEGIFALNKCSADLGT